MAHGGAQHPGAEAALHGGDGGRIGIRGGVEAQFTVEFQCVFAGARERFDSSDEWRGEHGDRPDHAFCVDHGGFWSAHRCVARLQCGEPHIGRADLNYCEALSWSRVFGAVASFLARRRPLAWRDRIELTIPLNSKRGNFF